MIITKKCPFTNTTNSYDIDITPMQHMKLSIRHSTGELIQNIAPNLELWEREFLMTGMSKDFQDAFFAENTSAFESPNVNDN